MWWNSHRSTYTERTFEGLSINIPRLAEVILHATDTNGIRRLLFTSNMNHTALLPAHLQPQLIDCNHEYSLAGNAHHNSRSCRSDSTFFSAWQIIHGSVASFRSVVSRKKCFYTSGILCWLLNLPRLSETSDKTPPLQALVKCVRICVNNLVCTAHISAET